MYLRWSPYAPPAFLRLFLRRVWNDDSAFGFEIAFRTSKGDAVVEAASATCVERFYAAPDSAAKLAEFKAMPDSFKLRQLVEAGGWATMPGQTPADRLGVQDCVTGIRA